MKEYSYFDGDGMFRFMEKIPFITLIYEILLLLSAVNCSIKENSKLEI
jgi:hypothetical protein